FRGWQVALSEAFREEHMQDAAKPTTMQQGGPQMRSIKLTSALAVVAMSVAVAPSGALAIKHHRHAHALSAKHCRVGFNAVPRFVEAGETALTFGVLLCPAGTNVSGQAVTIFQHTAGTGGASAAGTTSTDTTGRFQLQTAAL